MEVQRGSFSLRDVVRKCSEFLLNFQKFSRNSAEFSKNFQEFIRIVVESQP